MFCGKRWLLISKIFASCRPSSHIDLPLFLRYFTYIDMVILLVALALSAAHAQFSLIVARFRRAMFFWRLILATEVTFIVLVMHVMAALLVVVVAINAARHAIFGVIAALLLGVLGLVAMNVARFAN